ncbi:energy transducer TonB [Seonamhaeicola maritimus]|uniref:energy transducer TonB n=1 Tax=Seonamhaeicola maritimus TaxID=2591822 RepID=UPI0024944878|nr:energy transducer TonB [Seonamhaeicola maritimus]
MKKYIIIGLLCAFSNLIQGQEKNEVAFAVIEQVPIYKGCKKNLSNKEQRACMSSKVTKHVVKHFNIKVAKGLGFPDGKVRIDVIFKINTKGEVVGIRARGPHKKLEEEARRVIKLLPKFIPGYQKGKPVTVPYALPLIFNIDNSKYNKKK